MEGERNKVSYFVKSAFPAPSCSGQPSRENGAVMLAAQGKHAAKGATKDSEEKLETSMHHSRRRGRGCEAHFVSKPRPPATFPGAAGRPAPGGAWGA